MKELLSIFSSRELAIITWGIIIIIIILIKKVLRTNFLIFSKSLFVKNLMIPILIFIIYVTIVTIFISKIPLWKSVYIKDVIFWTLTVGIIYYLNSADRESNENYIKEVLKDNFKITVLFEFLYNTFTFPYIVELLLIPMLFFITLLEIITKRKLNSNKDYFYAHKFFESISYIVGIIMLIFTIIEIKNNYYKIDLSYELICFFIPFVYLILAIPLIYILQIVTNYQILFNRILLFGTFNKKEKYYRIISVIKVCNISIKKIIDLKYMYSKKGYLNIKREEFDNFIHNYKNKE